MSVWVCTHKRRFAHTSAGAQKPEESTDSLELEL